MSWAFEEARMEENMAYRKAIDVLQDHARKVQAAIREMVLAIEALASGDAKKLDEKVQVIAQVEKEADSLKYTLLDLLTKAAPSFLYREDFVRLILSVDELVEIAQSIVRLASRTAAKGWYPSKAIGEKMKNVAYEVFHVYEKLKDAVQALALNPRRALELVGEVHAAEGMVDELYRDLEMTILEEATSVGQVLSIKEICSLMEHLADRAEDSSDDIRILALHRVV